MTSRRSIPAADTRASCAVFWTLPCSRLASRRNWASRRAPSRCECLARFTQSRRTTSAGSLALLTADVTTRLGGACEFGPCWGLPLAPPLPLPRGWEAVAYQIARQPYLSARFSSKLLDLPRHGELPDWPGSRAAGAQHRQRPAADR